MGLGVGHRHRRLVGQRLERLQVLGRVGRLRALGPEEQEPAWLVLEAERHRHLGVESLPGAAPGGPQRREPRVGRHLVARERPRRGGEDPGEVGVRRAQGQPRVARVHGGLDRRGEAPRDLVEVEQAPHRAREGLDGARVVGALAEEGPVHRALDAIPQRVEGEHEREHERAREPRRADEVGLGEERVRPRDQEGVGAGDEGGERGVHDGAPDHHRGVEEPVADGRVGDRGRIQEHQRGAHLRVHRPLPEVRERRQHEGEPAAQPEPDAEEQHGGLLVDQGRRGAPPRVEQRHDLDGKRDHGEAELEGEEGAVEASVGEERGGGEVDGGEHHRHGCRHDDGGAVEPRRHAVALEPGLARGRARVGQEEHPPVDREQRGNEPGQRRSVAVRAQDGLGHGHVRGRPEAHVEEEVPVGAGRGVLAEHRHAGDRA